MALNRFLVPQFIETEPKILGPVTIRQFITLLVGAMFDFIVWNIFVNVNQNIGLVAMFVVTLLFLLFAFVKVNGQSFHYFFLNIIRTLKRPSLKIWKKDVITKLPHIAEIEVIEKITKILPPKSKLSDISLLVDTGGAYNIKEDEESSDLQELSI